METFYQRQNLKKDSKVVIFPYLNLLRFVAAMVVVFHHFAIQVPPFNDGVLNQWIGNGNFMVNLFFVLSGFVLYHRYQDADFCSISEYIVFYKKRARRLLPLYYIGLIMSLCYIIYVVGQVDVFRVILAFAGLQSFDIWSYPVINVPSWSLSVEFIFYLIFPLVFIFIVDRSRQFTLIFAVVFWVITEGLFYVLQSTYTDLYLHLNPFFSLPSFVLGMVFYRYLPLFKKTSKNMKVVRALIVLVITVVVLYQPYFYKNYSGLLAPLFGCLILSLAAIDTTLKNGNWMDKLGDLSYAIYILHWPIYKIYGFVVEYLDVPSRHTISVFMSYLLLVIIVSIIANFLQGLLMKKTSRQLPL